LEGEEEAERRRRSRGKEAERRARKVKGALTRGPAIFSHELNYFGLCCVFIIQGKFYCPNSSFVWGDGGTGEKMERRGSGEGDKLSNHLRG
jgi:hypothetical protein